MSLKSNCISEKHDTEGLKSSKPNSISCLHWQNLILADRDCLNLAAGVSALLLRAKISESYPQFLRHLLYNADFGIYAVVAQYFSESTTGHGRNQVKHPGAISDNYSLSRCPGCFT